MVPHGVAYEEFKAATENAPPEMQISKGAIAIMFESSRPFTISDYAWNSDKKHGQYLLRRMMMRCAES